MTAITNTLLVTIEQNKKIFALMILTFLLSILGAWDFITATSAYRDLELGKPLNFVIERKYNAVKRPIFPDLKYTGTILNSNKAEEIGVSRGDFDKNNVGDTITIFGSKSGNGYMTSYEIKNQKFIEYFGKPISFVVIPTIISFLAGLTILFVLIRKLNVNINGG